MHIWIPLDKPYPVEMTTALKFEKFMKIFVVEDWGTFEFSEQLQLGRDKGLFRSLWDLGKSHKEAEGIPHGL